VGILDNMICAFPRLGMEPEDREDDPEGGNGLSMLGGGHPMTSQFCRLCSA
jgi:hypothetical protein